MFFLWLLIGISNAAGAFEPDSGLIWNWFGHHVLLTILMILFLG